jgi:hypothetical protein
VEFTRCRLGQDAAFQLFSAVPDHWIQAENREVERRGAVHRRPGSRYLFEEDRRLSDAKARSTVLRRNADAEPARFGKRLVEVPWELMFFVAMPPVGIVEFRGKGPRLQPDLLLRLGQFEVQAIAFPANRDPGRCCDLGPHPGW